MSHQNVATGTRSSSTLSKNALYAPLSAYDAQDAQSYSSSRKKVPASIRESCLVEFLQCVSADFHQKAAGCQGKNNGGRPLALNEVDDRIRQRALTLVGGGINSKPPKRKETKFRLHRTTNKERKRLLPARKLASKAPVEVKTKLDNERNMDGILTRLHERWQKYIRELIGPNPAACLEKDATALASMSSRLAGCELRGGVVHIRKCPAHKQWLGTEGMVVDETYNTWHFVASSARRSNVKSTVGQGGQRALSFPKEGKVVVVPKANSELAFRVAIDAADVEFDGPQSLLVVIDGNSRRNA